MYSPEGSYSEVIDDDVLDSEQDLLHLFLQKENCFKTSPEVPQCRECAKDPDCDKYSCRFYEFRKVEKNNSDKSFKVAGFLDPHLDPSLAGKDFIN